MRHRLHLHREPPQPLPQPFPPAAGAQLRTQPDGYFYWIVPAISRREAQARERNRLRALLRRATTAPGARLRHDRQ